MDVNNNPNFIETANKTTAQGLQVGNVKSINWVKVILLVILLFLYGGLAFYAGYKFPVKDRKY